MAEASCICPHDYPMTEDRHAINCPASSQYKAWKAMTAPTNTPASPALDREGSFDPGGAAYEAAREQMVSVMRRIGAGEPRSGYAEKADALTRGELYEVPTWLALQMLARVLPSPPVEDRFEECALIVDAFANGQKREGDECGWDEGLQAGYETATMIAAAIRRRAALPAQPTEGEA